jgi:hypothetical protein
LETLNFVIIYNSREGSSAIVNILSGQPGIAVPVMEHLDGYRFEATAECPDIYSALNEVFSTTRYSGMKNRPPTYKMPTTIILFFQWDSNGESSVT